MRKIGIVAVFAASLVLAFSLAACSGGSGNQGGPSKEGSAPAEAPAAPDEGSAPVAEAPEAPEAPEAAPSEAAAAAAGAIALAAEDLAAVTDAVEFGDYDAMQALSKAIQNGEKTDAVVEIDGLVSNFAKGMSYNIVQENADGSGNIGTTFVIVGAEEDAYPADGTHVKLVGKVATEDNLTFKIYTLPEFVEVLE